MSWLPTKMFCARLGLHILQENVHFRACAAIKSQTRLLSVAGARCSDAKDVTKSSRTDEKAEEPKDAPPDTRRMAPVHWLDKRCLVWDKRYKSVEEVPEMLPYQAIVSSRNRFRIRANLVMIALTVLAACGMVYTGKERAKTGDTIDKRNLEKHRRLRAEKLEEDRLAAAQTPAK